MGVIRASFQSDGITRDIKERLNKCVSDFEIRGDASRTYFGVVDSHTAHRGTRINMIPVVIQRLPFTTNFADNDQWRSRHDLHTLWTRRRFGYQTPRSLQRKLRAVVMQTLPSLVAPHVAIMTACHIFLRFSITHTTMINAEWTYPVPLRHEKLIGHVVWWPSLGPLSWFSVIGVIKTLQLIWRSDTRRWSQW